MTGDARKNPTDDKFAPNWWSPYRVNQSLGKGAFKLEYLHYQKKNKNYQRYKSIENTKNLSINWSYINLPTDFWVRQ